MLTSPSIYIAAQHQANSESATHSTIEISIVQVRRTGLRTRCGDVYALERAYPYCVQYIRYHSFEELGLGS